MDFKITETDAGQESRVKFLGNLLEDGHISYFKLGEGGFRDSELWTQAIGIAGSTTYSGTLEWRLPISRNQFEITDGTLSVTDDGSGVLTGDGAGTIDYKTGEYSVVFSGTTTGTVEAKFKYHGQLSDDKTQVLIQGLDKDGVYSANILSIPVAPGSVSIFDEKGQELTDTPASPYDGTGTLSGDGSGTINYETGRCRFTFTASVESWETIKTTFQYDGAPSYPDWTLEDLESEGDANLYTFQKSFSDGDIEFLGNGKVKCKVVLEAYEGIDDGNGKIPYYFEGALFNENDIMVGYFTFSKIKKTGSTKIDFSIDPMI